MNRQPWTGTTRVGASHEPQVKRRQKTAKEQVDAAEAEYVAWRNGRWFRDLWSEEQP